MQAGSSYIKFSSSDPSLHTEGLRQFGVATTWRAAKVAFLIMVFLGISTLCFIGASTLITSRPRSLDFVSLGSDDLPPEVHLVELPIGSVLGTRSVAFGQVYRGIPYGTAERFQEAVSPLPWYPKILDATKFRASCLRKGNAFMSEDCLHLNVYTPLELSSNLHPVLVWFHGGSFTMGAGSDTTKEEVNKLVMTHRLIVVTINYRLGVFGFLGSERIRASPKATVGNWGTLDQQLSLKWVKTNIQHFGGDPSRVTLIGWSAGAASISVHLSMDSSKGLFHKAIMMSGGFTSWAAVDMSSAEANYDQTVHSIGCNNDPDCLKPGPICQCLRLASAENLVNFQPGGGWAPTIDGVELHHHPREAVKLGRVHKHLPIIIGGALEDCLVDIGAAATEENFLEYLNMTGAPKAIAPLYLNKVRIQELYYGPLGDAHKGWSPAYWALRQSKADKDMNCVAKHAAQLWYNASGAKAHWYLWAAPSAKLIDPPNTALKPSKGKLKVGGCWPCPGATHGSDLPYLFEHSELDVVDSKAVIADVYQTFFQDFVRTGDPNKWNGFAIGGVGNAWPSVHNGNGGMLFSLGETQYKPDLKDEECKAWGF